MEKKRKGNNENSDRFYFPGLQNHCGSWLQPWNQKTLASLKKIYKEFSVLKSRGITLLTKICIVKAMVSPVVMYSCESWVIMKAECQRIDGFELWYWRSKEIKLVNPEENQPWIFIGLMLKLELQTWPPDTRNWLTGKDPDAGKDWRWEEKGLTEDEMVGWHHWLSGHEFGWTLGDGDGQGSLACGSPWGNGDFDTNCWLENYRDKLYTHTYS